uniref:Alternative protein C10orf120 n=1 Tax=Homo sapiens TaxID=9606 RepID=L8E9J9_HUMAN|nr:alternative protein C10orf120 [Homo sapiens]
MEQILQIRPTDCPWEILPLGKRDPTSRWHSHHSSKKAFGLQARGRMQNAQGTTVAVSGLQTSNGV